MLHLFKQKQNKTHIKKSQWFYKMEIFAGAKEAVEADGGLAKRLKAYTHTHTSKRTSSMVKLRLIVFSA